MNKSKLSFSTPRQKKYMQAYIDTGLLAKQEKWIKTALEKLELPEASWTLQDLINSGAKFPHNFMGKVVYAKPDSTYLVGYKAFMNIISGCSICAALVQTMNGDTDKCKEYLYAAAYSQKVLCLWPEQNNVNNTNGLISLSHLIEYHMGVIADANDDLLNELGNLLRLPERNWNKFLINRGNAVILLVQGDKEQAKFYANNMLADELKKKKPKPIWVNYAKCIIAIIDGDAEEVNSTLCSIVQSWRRSPETVSLLVYHAIGLAKIAVKNGIDVTIDTMDCPQALIRPEQKDYSKLVLPKPQYGFPWERA